MGKLLTEEVNLFQKLQLFISLGAAIKSLVVVGRMSAIVFHKKNLVQGHALQKK